MPRSRRDRDDDDDDDDDDDRPRRRSRRDDDDDEDYEDRPRRKKKAGRKRAKSGGGSGPLLLILGSFGGLVLMVGAGIAVWLLFFNENPKSAFEDIQNKFVAKNYGGVYDRFDTDARKFFDGFAELAKLDPSFAPHRNKSGRELFVALCEENDKKNAASGKQDGMFDRWKRKSTVESVTESGDTATLTIKDADGKTSKMHMKKQDGKWRLSLGPGFGK